MSSSDAGGAITWPFFQPSWLFSLWMPIAWAVPLGNFLSLGWSVDAVRRRALDQTELLPQPEDIASLLGRGFVVFSVWLVYIVVPLLVMGWLMSWSWIIPIWQLVVVLWKTLWHEPHENLVSFLLQNIVVFFSDASAPILYVAIAGPLFFVGRLRYAVTGRARGFFRLVANMVFCFRNVGDVLLYFFLSTILRFVLVFFAILLLAVPVVGQLLPFVLGGAGIWIRAYWAARVALKMRIGSSIAN